MTLPFRVDLTVTSAHALEIFMKIQENSTSSKNTGGIGLFYRKYRKSCQACQSQTFKTYLIIALLVEKILVCRRVSSEVYDWQFMHGNTNIPLSQKNMSEYEPFIIEHSHGFSNKNTVIIIC